MGKPYIAIAGLPGKMATVFAETMLLKHLDDFIVFAQSLTGESQPREISLGRNFSFYLVPPEKHEEHLKGMTGNETYKPVIAVDFTQPDAVNRNAELYCKYGIPFVMGTTGGDRKALEQAVIDSGNIAVIAPNMALPIVALQAFMDDFSRRYKGEFKGYELSVRESHQAGKKDTSGTAKAMISYFQRMGIVFAPEQIEMIRNPEEQRAMGVPEEHLGGHGWHTYTLTTPERATIFPFATLRSTFRDFLEGKVFADYSDVSGPPYWKRVSPDGNVVVGIQDLGDKAVELFHNINGRQVYADGGIQLVGFLARRIEAGERGKVYTAVDALREMEVSKS